MSDKPRFLEVKDDYGEIIDSAVRELTENFDEIFNGLTVSQSMQAAAGVPKLNYPDVIQMIAMALLYAKELQTTVNNSKLQ